MSYDWLAAPVTAEARRAYLLALIEGGGGIFDRNYAAEKVRIAFRARVMNDLYGSLDTDRRRLFLQFIQER